MLIGSMLFLTMLGSGPTPSSYVMENTGFSEKYIEEVKDVTLRNTTDLPVGVSFNMISMPVIWDSELEISQRKRGEAFEQISIDILKQAYPPHTFQILANVRIFQADGQGAPLGEFDAVVWHEHLRTVTTIIEMKSGKKSSFIKARKSLVQVAKSHKLILEKPYEIRLSYMKSSDVVDLNDGSYLEAMNFQYVSEYLLIMEDIEGASSPKSTFSVADIVESDKLNGSHKN